MRTKILTLGLVCLFIIIFSCCNGKSPTSPEPPKPRAIINLDISDRPVYFYHSSWRGVYYSNFTVIISETNGVGVQITLLKLEFYVDNQMVASATETGGRVPANGTLEIYCDPECPDQYQFDTLKITATGADDNGYNITESMSLVFEWEMKLAKSLY